MDKRFSIGPWVILSLLVSVLALPVLGRSQGSAFETIVIIFALLLTAVMWAVTLATLKGWTLKDRIVAPLKWLRARTITYWLASLIVLLVLYAGWQLVSRMQICVVLNEMVTLDPTVSVCRINSFSNRTLQSSVDFLSALEAFYLLVGLWLLAFWFFWGLDENQRQAMGKRLAETRLTGLLITLTTLIIIVMGIEIWLRFFVDISQGDSRSSIHQNWLRKHWQPLNELGYRDYPVNTEVDEGVQRVLVLGDSIAAGWGVNTIDDSFPHILDQMLGDGYVVNVAARPGWDTAKAFEALEEYPVKPDIVILAYYFNDIMDIAERSESPDVVAVRDFFFEAIPNRPFFPVNWLVDNFYLPGFVHYNLLKPPAPNAYYEYLEAAYNDPEIWAEHARDMTALVDWAKVNDSQLYVYIWPELTDVAQFAALNARIEALFQDNEIPVIDDSASFAALSPGELVVNPFDSHPNLFSHTKAAESLYALIRGA